MQVKVKKRVSSKGSAEDGESNIFDEEGGNNESSLECVLAKEIKGKTRENKI